MSYFHFSPGIAGERLEELAKGTTKARVLRDLILTHHMVRYDLPPVYDEIIQIGRRIKSLGQKTIYRWDEIMELTDCALEIGRFLKKRRVNVSSPRQLETSSIRSAKGRGMSFQAKEAAERWNDLANFSGLSRSAVLRALILGIPLPDRMAMRTYARLSQIGGLVKRIALQNKVRDWYMAYAKGVANRKLAGKMEHGEFENRADLDALE